jgi:hypothetical protein
MKALAIAFTMVALAVAPAMWAQKAPAPQAEKAPAAKTAAADQTLTGCLSSQQNNFSLKTSSGTVQLQGDGLQAHVGHEIRVTGTQSTVAGKSVMKVTDIEMVANTCKS